MALKNRLDPQTLLALAVIFICFALRLVWIGDMEFKGDEKDIAQLIATLGTRPFQVGVTPSYHSGITPSAGFFYWVRWISLGATEPLTFGFAIALFNALSIAAPLWFLRHSRPALLGFTLSATSMAWVIHSRKIWNPDLVASWMSLSAMFLAMAIDAHFLKRRNLFLFLSGFTLVISGHMYLPGIFFGGLGTALAFIGVVLDFFPRSAQPNRFWLWGSLLGWITFIPYFALMLFHSESFFRPGASTPHLAWDQLWNIVKMEATLPTPYSIYSLYLRPALSWMRQYSPSLILELTVFWTLLSSVLGAFLFWICLIRMTCQWRKALQNPILLGALCLLLFTPIALFFMRLGTYIHYWLGVLPWVYYGMGWAVSSKGSSIKLQKTLKTAAWACCILSAIATVHFLILVHVNHGLPGEYGPAFHMQNGK